MIAINKEYLSEPVPQYDTNCEIVWTKIRLVNAKSNIIIAGDFNLPEWEWKTKTLKDNTQYSKIHTKFKDILDDYSLIQMNQQEERTPKTSSLLTTHPHSQEQKQYRISRTMILSSLKLISQPKRKYKNQEVFHYTKRPTGKTSKWFVINPPNNERLREK